MVTGQNTAVGYNAQVAVDTKHMLIVEGHVAKVATDMGLLASTAGAAREARPRHQQRAQYAQNTVRRRLTQMRQGTEVGPLRYGDRRSRRLGRIELIVSPRGSRDCLPISRIATTPCRFLPQSRRRTIVFLSKLTRVD